MGAVGQQADADRQIPAAGDRINLGVAQTELDVYFGMATAEFGMTGAVIDCRRDSGRFVRSSKLVAERSATTPSCVLKPSRSLQWSTVRRTNDRGGGRIHRRSHTGQRDQGLALAKAQHRQK